MTKATFLRAPATAPTQPLGALQIFDGYFPALPAKNYTLTLNHAVNPPAGETAGSYGVTQAIEVVAPQFSIDTNIVQSVFPPAGGADLYDETLPFIVLAEPALPWERDLDPSSPGEADPAKPTPWMALLIFAEGELTLQPSTSSPIQTMTVAQLLTADPNFLKPPLAVTDPDILASQCQTIIVSGAAFRATTPTADELALTAHCRGVNALDERVGLASVLLCNRLAIANSSGTTRYYAHLVSLEGFAPYLGPNGQALPEKPSGGVVDVQLVSLYNWSFSSLPATAISFKSLLAGLITSEQATASLALPIPSSASPPAAVAGRLNDGYAPITFVAGSGDQSFAWYRGPLSPVVPQPLPEVGDPATPVALAKNADELLIYDQGAGLFDLSYSSAWNIGRALALADASFAQDINATRLAANCAVTTIAQKAALTHMAGITEPRQLLARDAAKRAFTGHVAGGLGQRWTDALNAARSNDHPLATPMNQHRRTRVRRRVPRAVAGHVMLTTASAGEALSQNLAEKTQSAAQWLAALRRLQPLPFSYLVPHPAMLPTESIRFFYVDQQWLDALTAGATSIAVHHAGDSAVRRAMVPSLSAAIRNAERTMQARPHPLTAMAPPQPTVAMTGVLIRSQLVDDWPDLVVSATLDGAPVAMIRDDRLAPSVRLCLFQGIPDAVTLAEPYQGLRFGVEDSNQIYARAVTSLANVGAQLLDVAPVTAPLRAATGLSSPPSVLDLTSLAPALATACGVLEFDAGAVVNWNQTALPTTFVGPHQLTATIDASSLGSVGTAAIVVKNSGGIPSQPANFTINPSFATTGLEPLAVLAGSSDFMLLVEGEGFASGAVVSWNGTALPTKFVAVTQLQASVTATQIADPGSAAITVVLDGATTNAVSLPILASDPILKTVTPNIAVAGAVGFTLYLSGAQFDGSAVAQWNGSPLATSFVDDQSLTATVPASVIANAGAVSIAVQSGGATSNVLPFTVAASKPTIGFARPAVAMQNGSGFTLVVDGVNFATTAVVQWNGNPLSTTVDDSGQLTATVPAGLLTTAGDAAVTVLSGGTESNSVTVSVLTPQPVIGLLDPVIAPVGSGSIKLTVYGGFGPGGLAIQLVKAPESQTFLPS
ncbi:MAG: hypothetical protein HEQ34_01610 [Sphingorhabdus sp.]|uniref:IPT/TIG domain-containing protein n=1 Tax=Sphingorhabdus sp. TaxID=1902408 RepID=UPI0025FF3866|nr:IPT/TIG domain-containing protein [Sphingorhabdus sp.]MCO4090636.1 hypothetical protein [Sphingorhabdus sp.]